MVSFVNEFRDVFGGIGKFLNSYHIDFDDSVPPCVNPSRRTPLAIHEKAKNVSKIIGLDFMESNIIIKKLIMLPIELI